MMCAGVFLEQEGDISVITVASVGEALTLIGIGEV